MNHFDVMLHTTCVVEKDTENHLRRSTDDDLRAEAYQEMIKEKVLNADEGEIRGAISDDSYSKRCKLYEAYKSTESVDLECVMAEILYDYFTGVNPE